MNPIDSPAVAATQPHAMVNDAGDVFYPDSPEDAAWFAAEHNARPLHPDAEESKATPRADTNETQAERLQNLRIQGSRRL